MEGDSKCPPLSQASHAHTVGTHVLTHEYIPTHTTLNASTELMRRPSMKQSQQLP